MNDEIFTIAMNENDNKTVMEIASRRFRMPENDKEQCKLLGLWDAVRLYDSTKGVPFKLFLSLRVKFRCLHWCHANYQSKLKYTESYNFPQNGKIEYLQNPKGNQTECPKTFKYKTQAGDLLMSLTVDEHYLITQRYYHNRSLSDIGQEFGVSYETIRKKIKSILEKFKDD